MESLSLAKHYEGCRYGSPLACLSIDWLVGENKTRANGWHCIFNEKWAWLLKNFAYITLLSEFLYISVPRILLICAFSKLRCPFLNWSILPRQFWIAQVLRNFENAQVYCAILTATCAILAISMKQFLQQQVTWKKGRLPLTPLPTWSNSTCKSKVSSCSYKKQFLGCSLRGALVVWLTGVAYHTQLNKLVNSWARKTFVQLWNLHF